MPERQHPLEKRLAAKSRENEIIESGFGKASATNRASPTQYLETRPQHVMYFFVPPFIEPDSSGFYRFVILNMADNDVGRVKYLDARYSTFNQPCNQTTNYTILMISPCVSPRQPRRTAINVADTISLPISNPETSRQGVPVAYSSANSVAIVQTVVRLIEKITELLMDSRKASIGHRNLALELESLQITLTLTRLAIQMYENKPLGEILANTITPEVLGCLFVLWELFDRIDGTWVDLSITSVGGFWRRIWGVWWGGDEFPSLRRKLSYSRQSLQGLLMALHSVAWMELGNELRAGFVSLQKFHNAYHQRLPSLYHIKLDLVNVVNHVGHDISIPVIFCAAWEDFDYIIKCHCRGCAGFPFIERGDYKIIRTEDSQILGPSELESMLQPGMKLEIIIMMWQRMADRKKCPRCTYINWQVVASSSWVECCKCSGQFRIIEASRNKRSEKRDVGLAMECYVDEKPGDNGNAESRGEDRVSPAPQMRAGIKRGTSAITTQRWEDDGGIYHDDASNSDDTKFFRRIQVICMMIMEETMFEERRIQHSSILLDFDKTISAIEQNVHLTPDDHASKPGHLGNLGISFKHRFEHSGDLIDIDRAIFSQEQAIHLTSNGHASRPSHLSNLGIFFKHRFAHSGQLVDIDNAIHAQEQAVHLTPDGHIAKPGYLHHLGDSLFSRSNCSGKLADIDMAISAQKRAVDFTPDCHANKPGYLTSLANSYLSRFEHFADLADRRTAISHYRLAAHSTGSPSIQFHAALRWARLESRINISLQGYTIAFNLLPQVGWLGQTIQTRRRDLNSIGNVACEAAAAAISAAQYDTALEWLEQGRSISVWNQVYHLRSPVKVLREIQPRFADDLMRASNALEHAVTHNEEAQNLSTQSNQQFPMEQVAQLHRRLAEEWEILVKRVRDIPGFQDLFQPKKFTQLCSAAHRGPVVVVNVHKRRCDALVVMAGLNEVMHIPLERLSYEKARHLHQSLNQLLSAGGICDSPTQGVGFPHILSELWTCVAKPVLDSLAFPASLKADPPRIWWCLTGPLGFLPIHAAGLYNQSAVGFNVSDYVISSYTLTLSLLIDAVEYHKKHRNFRGLLAVSQLNTPGQSPLPNTTTEVTRIQRQARGLSVRVLEGPAASVESVMQGMGTCSWVHFACHGIQDTITPTKSALYFHDGCLELSTVISKSFSNADFAFLSACHTARGDDTLSEEAVHLAAGLMLAGYRSVIGTMWSIVDADAPVIANHVYSNLFDDTEPDSAKAALAMHRAVKLLRQQRGDYSFMSWVPWIHMGI